MLLTIFILVAWSIVGFAIYLATAGVSKRSKTVRRITIFLAGPGVWAFFAYFIVKALVDIVLMKKGRA